jgi:hypothetical protein
MRRLWRSGSFTTTSAVCIPVCVTPAMEAGISDHVWTIEELCGLLPQPISSTREAEKNLVIKALAQ